MQKDHVLSQKEKERITCKRLTCKRITSVMAGPLKEILQGGEGGTRAYMGVGVGVGVSVGLVVCVFGSLCDCSQT